MALTIAWAACARDCVADCLCGSDPGEKGAPGVSGGEGRKGKASAPGPSVAFAAWSAS
jgi:hypothetical protein